MIHTVWINNATIVCSLVLLVFLMVQVTLAMALNLRANQWTKSAGDYFSPTLVSTTIALLLDALLIFPCAIVGITAAISRSFKVYVVLMILSCLSFLAAIGGLAVMAYISSMNSLFADAGSVNDELTICLLVFQCLVVLATILVGTFTIIALTKQQAYHRRRDPYKPKYQKHVAEYPPGYYSSLAAASPRRTMSDAGGYYRPLTYGSPEWDRFYSDYKKSLSPAGGQRKPYRSYSYRM